MQKVGDWQIVFIVQSALMIKCATASATSVLKEGILTAVAQRGTRRKSLYSAREREGACTPRGRHATW
jgi:hypothetical protein